MDKVNVNDWLPEGFPDIRGRRVVVAMSGGVDSSVTAALLAHAGADVVGVFLHVWDYNREDVNRHGSCCALEDSYDARRVADHLGIPFYSMDMREAFRRDVIDPFIADYEHGRTPNPCERCNRFVKFGALLEVADKLEAEFVATGHYVRRLDNANGVRIYKGADTRKDQSYFLATTNRQQAARLLFPVGHLVKNETRGLARAFGLSTADKHESQDICFIPPFCSARGLRPDSGQVSSSTARAICSAGMPASPTTRWASARAWACPAGHGMWWRWTGSTPALSSPCRSRR